MGVNNQLKNNFKTLILRKIHVVTGDRKGKRFNEKEMDEWMRRISGRQRPEADGMLETKVLNFETLLLLFLPFYSVFMVHRTKKYLVFLFAKHKAVASSITASTNRKELHTHTPLTTPIAFF